MADEQLGGAAFCAECLDLCQEILATELPEPVAGQPD
jgi:hypothetical protein